VLEEVRIRGLGVIDDATLPLGSGLTAVTGETGAGKTMVVSGLLLLFGGRGEAARVRSGAEQTVVDGRVEIAATGAAAERVRDAGGDLDDAPDGNAGLALRRTVTSAGRSRAYVGGAPTPVAVLGDLADQLLTVHGQSDQLRLTRPGEQRAALDRYAGLDVAGFAADFAAWREAAEALDERRGRMAELRREADLLNHGLAEITDVDPQHGEDVELTAAASRLAHADALALAARTAHDALLGDPDDPIGEASDVAALLGAARRLLDAQQGTDVELDELTRRLVDLAALAADLGAEFGAYAAAIDTDPARLEQIELRRADLAALVRKYGEGPDAGLAAVHAWADAARRRLADIDVSDEAIAALTARRDEAAERVARAASDLRRRRIAAAGTLAAAVTTELRELAMADASCTITVQPRAASAGLPALAVDDAECAVGPDGADDVELRFRSHPDAPDLPIGRSASGGELSRVMLALEVCLAGTDPVPTMIFDEVDAGVGGRAATEVGRRLARLGREHQVVVVTHLAQVAAFADNHIVVDKNGAAAGVTAADVRVVSGDQRVAELARMLGGSATESALEHAAELLRTARNDGLRSKPPGKPSARARTDKRTVKTR
jgi:DNA repair protein RecN (Recombination protein N)